ncbi:hypothetical protein BGX38DRAFT_143621 [Terfezia claveryi]|nr:hypothetical protein BGX38DRAFT_143621 [Terfezia claveryi]
MAGAQHVGGFDSIINVNWPETQELFNAARRCLDRFHRELNNLDIFTPEPSNQEISSLLHYLAQKALDIVPHNTQQSIYADSLTAAWLYASASPWNPLGGIRSAEKADPGSTTVRPEFSNSFPPLECNPRNSSHETRHPQPTLPAEPQNLEVLNPSALAQTQPLHHGTNALTYQPTNAPRKNGRCSIAHSNDASQLDFQWSRESQKTSITPPKFHGTPNRSSVIAGVGPLSTSSKSLEDDCSHSVTQEQVSGSVVGPGARRERPLTSTEVGSSHTEAAPCNPEQVQEIPKSAVSPATTTGGNAQKKKFYCNFRGCNKSFDWEWKSEDHRKVHTKEKSFCCPDCNAYFGRDRDLVKHKLSQKHKKATHGLSLQSITSSMDTNLRASSAVARGKSPGSASRPSRGRTGSSVGSRRGPPAATSSTSVAVRGNGEMEVSGNAGDEADSIAQTPSDPTAGGNLAQAYTPTSRSRSVKRIRTISDIDTNNEDESDTEVTRGPDTESFCTSPISPAAGRCRNLVPYPPIPPSRSNCSSSSLSPTQISHRRRPKPHRIFNNSTDGSVVAISNVPAITFSLFRSPMLPTDESQGVGWQLAPTEDRATTSSVMTSTDDYMQYINMDYDPPQTTHAPQPQQPILWNTASGDTLSTISTSEYHRDLSARSCGAGSDGG